MIVFPKGFSRDVEADSSCRVKHDQTGGGDVMVPGSGKVGRTDTETLETVEKHILICCAGWFLTYLEET